ncbi:acyltransferase [Kushneria konosiri]|uniref:Acyltransferase n=1 Tax=Kushneria konosiri TaxID=698828 RepID=A0A2Z2H980_9GAMM|nr:acyltransferase [Kushneria konosiri]ARS54019.1 acyltransferase [Kushneria konosiri]
MAWLKGIISIVLLTGNTLFWGIPLVVLSLLKLVLPFKSVQVPLLKCLNRIAGFWITTNNLWIRHWLKPQWHIDLPDSLSRERHWLVIANHRSWTDVFIMLYALHDRLPIPRFFIKRELIWIPIMGLAWWALEFPMMRRYTPSQLKRRPHLARRDLQATRKLLTHIDRTPVTIYNFAEGTRFTRARHEQQESPYQYLLKPRAGGCAQVMTMMGHKLSGIIDVTLDYRQGRPRFRDLLCGKSGRIILKARRLDIPEWMPNGDYLNNTHYRERFQAWINALWQEKDQQLSCSIVS